MSEPSLTLQQALHDLREINRAIVRVEGVERGEYDPIITPTHRISHLVAMVVVGTLIASEIITHHNSTNFLYYSYHDERWRFVAVAIIAIILSSLVSAFYFSIWREARREGEEFDCYLMRSFTYMRNTSFLSDIFVKFSTLALIILARRPDWVAPLLLIFIGDYLLQGRFFVLKVRHALFVGMSCVLAGIIQFIYFEGVILYPLVVFFVIAGWSLYRICKINKSTLVLIKP